MHPGCRTETIQPENLFRAIHTVLMWQWSSLNRFFFWNSFEYRYTGYGLLRENSGQKKYHFNIIICLLQLVELSSSSFIIKTKDIFVWFQGGDDITYRRWTTSYFYYLAWSLQLLAGMSVTSKCVFQNSNVVLTQCTHRVQIFHSYLSRR